MDSATHIADDRIGRSWFRSPRGRRFAFELGAIILAKIIAMALLYFFLFAQARVPTTPAVMRDHLAESAMPIRCDDRS